MAGRAVEAAVGRVARFGPHWLPNRTEYGAEWHGQAHMAWPERARLPCVRRSRNAQTDALTPGVRHPWCVPVGWSAPVPV
jgi:hypothetical protein